MKQKEDTTDNQRELDNNDSITLRDNELTIEFICQEYINKVVEVDDVVNKLGLYFPSGLFRENRAFPLDNIDFSPLSHLEHLEEITIGYLISDSLAPILQHTKNVRNVHLNRTGPTCSVLLKSLSLLTELEHLKIFSPPVGGTNGLSSIGENSSLKSVILEMLNPVKIDLSILSSLEQLTELRITECHWVDVDINEIDSQEYFVEKFDWGYQMAVPHPIRELDLTPLSTCHNLQTLGISGLELSNIDLTPLASCYSLEDIRFTSNALTSVDLAPLSECPISSLDLGVGAIGAHRWGNRLKDIDLTPLIECCTLQVLRLNNNRFENLDISALSECTILRSVDLSYNQLRFVDLSPLSNCEHLKFIHMDGNPLEEIEPNLAEWSKKDIVRGVVLDEQVVRPKFIRSGME